MTLNYQMTVERYPNRMEWLVVQILIVKTSLYLTEKLAKKSNTSCVPKRKKEKDTHTTSKNDEISGYIAGTI